MHVCVSCTNAFMFRQRTLNMSNTSKTSMDFGGECVLYFRHFQCLYDLFVCVCAHTRCLFLHTCCLCVCAHNRVCARVCAHVCMRECMRAYMLVCLCVCTYECVCSTRFACAAPSQHPKFPRVFQRLLNFHVNFNNLKFHVQFNNL